MLTAVEHKALKLTSELASLVITEIIGYDKPRTRDVDEFVAHIHDIQRIIMSQSAARQHPDLYRLLGEAMRIKSEEKNDHTSTPTL